MSTRDKVLSAIFGLLILTTIAAIIYVNQAPPKSGGFTEFYVLGVGGEAEGYPRELRVGEEGRVLLGVVNHEYEPVSYRVVVRVNEVQSGEIGPIVLEHDQGWEQEVGFVLEQAGEDQAVEFLLYKDGEPEAHDALHLWINVE